MISEKMMQLGKKRSVIREIFEYSKKRKAEIGAENVFDFSIGNPSVAAPDTVKNVMIDLLANTDPVALHGYTSAQGDAGVRAAIAKDIEDEFGVTVDSNLIYMTCGAAASLTVSLHAICLPGDEVIALAPFFPEYRVFVEKAGASLRIVPTLDGSFQMDFDAIAAAINEKTKAIIINSPNNPTGVIFPEADIAKLGELLRAKEAELGIEIYLITDEPYRKLVYGGIHVAYVPKHYARTLVCYSYSKALSLPGERIGYILVSPDMPAAGDVYAAICGAGRALGFVCAPSLLQYTVAKCLRDTADVSVYAENRALLCDSLRKMGYQVTEPDGAFYLFVKAAEADAYAFCDRAKQFELLLVPSDDFGCPGYVRIAYCVATETIRRALPAFEKLMETYK